MSIFQNKSQIVQALSKLKGVGNAKIISFYERIIRESENLEDIWIKIVVETKTDLSSDEIISKVKKDIEYANQNGIGIITIADQGFPIITSSRVPKGDIPTILYYVGDVSLLQNINKNVSIIGTRNPDSFGLRACEVLTEKIASMGYNILSGLAKGCDFVAHSTSLKCGAKTIAILPTPPNNTKINKELAQQIIRAGGLLVSEYLYPDHSATEYSRNCAKRDKLVAMYCNCLVLASSGIKSGSAITVENAKKYGTKVAAIKPIGQYDQERFALNFALLNTFDGLTTSILVNEQGQIDLENWNCAK